MELKMTTYAEISNEYGIKLAKNYAGALLEVTWIHAYQWINHPLELSLRQHLLMEISHHWNKLSYLVSHQVIEEQYNCLP
jgi:hypothetical protein